MIWQTLAFLLGSALDRLQAAAAAAAAASQDLAFSLGCLSVVFRDVQATHFSACQQLRVWPGGIESVPMTWVRLAVTALAMSESPQM